MDSRELDKYVMIYSFNLSLKYDITYKITINNVWSMSKKTLIDYYKNESIYWDNLGKFKKGSFLEDFEFVPVDKLEFTSKLLTPDEFKIIKTTDKDNPLKFKYLE